MDEPLMPRLNDFEALLEGKSCSFDISPTEEMNLGSAWTKGYDWAGIKEPLEMSIVVLYNQGSNDPFVICSVDALYVGDEIKGVVLGAVPRLREDRLWMAATHTHRAPMLDESKPKLGSVDADHLKAVAGRIRQEIDQMMSGSSSSVRVFVSSAFASHSINRRRRQLFVPGRPARFFSVGISPNPDGMTDEQVTVIRLVDDQDKDLAVLWSYACHPVGAPWRNAVAAHFPYVVRNAIRRESGNGDLPVGYLQGFSGNVRPSGTVAKSQNILKRMLLGKAVFTDMSEAEYDDWSLALTEVVMGAYRDASSISGGPIVSALDIVDGSLISSGQLQPVMFRGVAFGADLWLFGISAEPVVEYVDFVRSISRSRHTVCVGCLDNPYGYLPTERMIREGGYEADGFRASFGLSELNLQAEHVAKSALKRVASSLEDELSSMAGLS